MRNSIIAAVDQNNAIGYKNRLPWHLPAELRLFNQYTMSHHIFMGRNTFESIAKPLPGRINIVVTRNPNYQAQGCLVAHSIQEALALAEANGESEVFNCGGTEIYRQGLITADRLYLSRIHSQFQADAYFPDFDISLWVEASSVFYPADDQNPYSFTSYIYNRK
jgi:dihydrofolate reductase